MTSGQELSPRQSTAGPPVEIRETHSGVVLLLGERAYKLKRPVDLGFLDFSTPQRREAACRREVDLNRRIAPDVYDGVGEIRGPGGDILEHLVVMRRMPDERRLARLVGSGAPVDDELRAVARAVTDFHTRCENGPAVAVDGTRDALARRWRSNLSESRRFRGVLLDGAALDAVERLVERFLSGRAALFEDRIARGAVVDGHGDLLADDIFCLVDGPRILDCLEFDDALRHLDRIDDFACLVMDLERLGAPGAGRVLYDHYVELSGDSAPASLLDHYVAYRAFMRAKVTCLRVESTGTGRDEAQALLGIALGHLARSRVSLTVVGGPPGTGKSALASALADRLGAVVLSSDRVRKELAGVSPETAKSAAFGHGLYTGSWTDRTYEELLRRAGRLLAMGESIVLDASWAQATRRVAARRLAQESSSDLSEIRCKAPVDVAESRIRGRRGGPSDADVEIAREMRAHFEPWPEAADVMTTRPLAAEVQSVFELVRPPVR